MGKITGIEVEKHNKNRSNIYIDNRYYCSLNNLTILQNRLEVGHIITESSLNEMQMNSEKDNAFDRALKFISKSMKTKYQIKTYLKEKGYVDEIADYVIKKMTEYKYLDDEFLALNYAKELTLKYGEYGIRCKLIEKGLSEINIDKALSEISKNDYLDGAYNLAKKYVGNKNINEIKDKVYNYLSQRTFDSSTIKQVIEKLKEENE